MIREVTPACRKDAVGKQCCYGRQHDAGMKTLLLLRHAKSSWADSNLRDFDRPLNERGLKAAMLMGKFIRKRKIEPGLIISSPAKRARETASLVKESGKLIAELRFDERIYEADTETLLKVVSQIDENVDTVMLVGHNPGMQQLLQALTGEAEEVPTATLMQISLKLDKWSAVQERSGSLEWLVRPKELAKG